MNKRDKRLEKSIEVLNAYKRLFSTTDGEIVLNDLMSISCFLTPTHVVQDTASTANNEGKRELFLYILRNLTTDSKEILKRIERIKEQQQEEDFYGE